MKCFFKKIFTFLTIFAFAFCLTACNMEELMENLQQGIPNIGGGNVEQTPDEPVVQPTPTPETPEPETQTPITPEDMTKTGLYVRGSMNEWSVHEKYELKYNWDGSGYPTITLNLFKNDEFKVADIDWKVDYGYNDEITLDFMDSFGNIKVVNDGLYLIQIIDGKIVIKQSAGNGYFNTNLDYGITIWTDPTMCFKDQDNSWNMNGNGLFISVDSQGRIAYMVYKPKDGYGMPNTNTYARHSIYNDYRDNPTFSEVYFDYNEDIKYRLVTPTDGFVITAYGDSAYDILTRSMFGRYILGDECLTFNNSRFDVNSLRITYDELGNIYCTKVVDDTNKPTLSGIAEKIQNEYDALKAGTTDEHTMWSVTGTVIAMESNYRNSNGNYSVKLILDVEGLMLGVYEGRINGQYPVTISGLEVGSEVTVTGEIDERYTLTVGDYTANIDFSRPNISWNADLTKSGIYVRGTFNGWEAVDSYELRLKEQGLGTPSLNVYLETGDLFKVATEDWDTVDLGYDEKLGSDFSADGVNIRVNNSGNYLISVINGRLVVERILPGILNTDNIDANGAGVWTNSGAVIKNTNNTWEITNGWRLYVVVDAEGCIAYTVYMPLIGYGDPLSTSYLRHSKYADYKTNPAFANVSEVYEGKWGPTVDYSLVVPEGGFVITASNEVIIDEISSSILGVTFDGDGYRVINDSTAYDVDNVRVHFEEETGRILFETVFYGDVELILSDYALEYGWENGRQYPEIYFDAFTTITSTGTPYGGYGFNTGKFYTSDLTWRIYQNEQATITFNSIKEISHICVEYNSHNGGVLVYDDTQYESLDVIEVNDNTITLSVGNKSEITRGQVRITAITIKYAE